MSISEKDILLLRACWSGDIVMAKKALLEGANPNASIPNEEENFLVEPSFWGTRPKGSGTVVEFAIWRRYDEILIALINQGGLIQPHFVSSIKFDKNELAMRLFIEQGGDVTHRDYHWAKTHGFATVLRALEQRGITSSRPCYDVDLLLKDKSPRQVAYWIANYVGTEDSILLESEKVLRDIEEVSSICANGMLDAVRQNNFPDLLRLSPALEVIGAKVLLNLIATCRENYRRHGAVVDLEIEEEAGSSISPDSFNLYKAELDEMDSKHWSEFESDLAAAEESYLLKNLEELRCRKSRQ